MGDPVSKTKGAKTLSSLYLEWLSTYFKIMECTVCEHLQRIFFFLIISFCCCFLTSTHFLMDLGVHEAGSRFSPGYYLGKICEYFVMYQFEFRGEMEVLFGIISVYLGPSH